MIDYGGSNLRSAQKAFEFMGAVVHVTSDPHEVVKASKLVLPGVGAFGAGMAAVRARGLETAGQEAAAKGTPFLGICVGMQFLFDTSDEMGQHTGLRLVPGRVTRFVEVNSEQSAVNSEQLAVNSQQSTQLETQNSKLETQNSKLKIPHMGWNQLLHNGRSPLLHNVPNAAYTYFVHSYYCIPNDETNVIAWTEYGRSFASVVGKDNIFGLQFHPEKSQQVGLQIIKNFLEM